MSIPTDSVLADFFDNAPVALHCVGPDGTILRANRAALDLLGYTPGEYIGLHIAEFHADQDMIEDVLQRLTRGETLRNHEARLRCKDGSIKHVLIDSNALWENGRFVHARCIMHDVTERRRAEHERAELLAREQRIRAEAQASAENLRRLQTVTDAALARLDIHELPRELLSRVRAVLDADTATILLLDDTGEHLVILASDGLREDVEEQVRARIGRGFAGTIAATGEPKIVDDVTQVEVLSPFLRDRIRSLLGVPLVLEDRVIGVVHVGTVRARRFTTADADLLRLVADRLALLVQQARLYQLERRARAEAEEANRTKDEFLATLGHELRNPLGAISNAVAVLNQLGKPEDQGARLREIIARQTRHLARLVEDLLDVARISSGKITLRWQPVDLRQMAERSLAALEQAGRTTQHQISLGLASALVKGDPARLEQIVGNLLDNALKYTPAGGRISLTIERDGKDAALRVKDTGPGIAPEMLPRLFERFVQGDQSLDRPQSGLGLGLTVVKRLVELHHGTISALSEGPGHGSEFIVRLPLLPPSPKNERVEPAPPMATSRRILVIEDNQDSRDGLCLLLEKSGHHVEEAGDGMSGVDKLLTLRPDIALVDVALPGLDGYAIAQAVRAAPGGDRIFLVALTGYGRPEDRHRAEQAGFDAHLVKPVEAEELLRVLARVRQ